MHRDIHTMLYTLYMDKYIQIHCCYYYEQIMLDQLKIKNKSFYFIFVPSPMLFFSLN